MTQKNKILVCDDEENILWIFKKALDEKGFIVDTASDAAAALEKIKQNGDTAIKKWIDSQLEGTSVTVVLVGEKTCSSRWVKYEIEESIKKGNGLLGIDVSKIEDLQNNTSERCGEIPEGYTFYLWKKDDGYKNMGDWIEEAATNASR